MTRVRRLLRLLPLVVLFAATACGEVPQSTEKARGVYSGVNVVLALTISLIVVAGAAVVGAIAFDRFVRSRRELAVAPEVLEEEEEAEEIVAGIGVGRGAVPRWLYGFYVIIPLFALLYVFNNVSLRPPKASGPKPTATPSGPVTETTVLAKQVVFDPTQLALVAGAKVTITMDNQDAGVLHNLTVWKDKAAAESAAAAGKIANTANVTGVAKADVSFTTASSGTLYFDCTVHPTSMFGDITLTKK